MYKALYRKYRPEDFNSVVGQDSIIKTLKNSIIHNNFSHAYLFFGSRGTGKTTISKIFARNINCLNPIDGMACQKCDNCKASFDKSCPDIIEIDAASNNGVDEIRELKNKISLVPTSLKYKVYIIDEVHMLSIGAFNALLKTLEEPPSHAIFILATTDPQKVPETIVSRCQCYSFKKISVSVIEEKLKEICKKEKISIEDDVLKNISILSDGGLRDALGLLDKLASYTNDKITMEDFIEINGIISNDQLHSFISLIMNGDIKGVLEQIELFDNNGKNLIQIIIQLLNYLRNLLVDYYLKNEKEEFSIDLLQQFINLLNEKMFDIKKSDNPRIYFEVFLLKFMNDYIINTRSNCIEKTIEKVEKPINSSKKESNEDLKSEKKEEISVENSSDDEEYDFDKEYGDESDDISIVSDVRSGVSEDPKILNIDEIMSVRINNTLALANKKLLSDEIKKFELLRDFTFDQEIGYIACSLLDSKVRVVSPSNILISFEYDSNVKQNIDILDKINDVYNKITNSNKKFAIVSDEEWEKIKKKYIEDLKNNISYEVKDEPEVIFEELEKNDIIGSSAIELFGDIVEID